MKCLLTIKIPPQDNAIQSLLEAKLAGGYSYLAANVVNHPSTSWIHAQIGALRVCSRPQSWQQSCIGVISGHYVHEKCLCRCMAFS